MELWCLTPLLQQGLEVDTLLNCVPDGRFDDLQHHTQIGFVLGVVSMFTPNQPPRTGPVRNANEGRRQS